MLLSLNVNKVGNRGPPSLTLSGSHVSHKSSLFDLLLSNYINNIIMFNKHQRQKVRIQLTLTAHVNEDYALIRATTLIFNVCFQRRTKIDRFKFARLIIKETLLKK